MFPIALPSFLFVIILSFLKFIYFFETHLFGDKTLQLPLHLSKLIMNG